MSNSTRPSSSYDERFVVPLEASRRGAHRARVSPVMAALPVVLVVGIVIGAIGLVYVLFGSLGGADSSTTAASASPSVAPTSSPSPSASGVGSDTPPSGSGTVASGTVDKTITVSVYNGTSPVVSGLARKAGNKLAAGGWTLGEVQTWTGTPVAATTVYYGTDSQRATAAAVAKTLGKGVLKLNAANAGQGIAVVVGNDYPSVGAGSGVGTTPRATTTHSTRSTSSTRSSNASATSSTTNPTETTAPPSGSTSTSAG